MEEKTKDTLIKIIVAVVGIAILFDVIMGIYAGIKYGDRPITEVPWWVIKYL